MKRKIALLLALVMVLSMVPMMSFAASSNAVDRVVSVDRNYNFNSNLAQAPRLHLRESEPGTSWRANDVFRLVLSEGLKWNADAHTTVASNVYDGSQTFDFLDPAATNYTMGDDTVGHRAVRVSDTELEVTIKSVSNDRNNFWIPMNVDMNGFVGEAKVTVIPVDSGQSGGTYTFANSSKGGTVTTVDKVRTIGRTGSTGTIRIEETNSGAVNGNQTLTLKLPNNFEWDYTSGDTLVTFSGGYRTPLTMNYGDVNVSLEGERTLKINLTGLDNTSGGTRGAMTITPKIKADRNAKYGDVSLSISGTGNISSEDIVIAKYQDWGAVVEVEEVKELVAGKVNDVITTALITVEETAPGALIENREVEVVLPTWVKVVGITEFEDSHVDVTAVSEDIERGRNTIAFRIDSGNSTSNLGSFEFEAQLSIQADKTGDIVAEFSGAGMEKQELVVAKAIASVTVESKEGAPVKIGLQSQEAPSFRIIENKKEAIERRQDKFEYQTTESDRLELDNLTAEVNNDITDGNITVTLPQGVRFAATPTVKVVKGNGEIYEDSIVLQEGNNTPNARLVIPVKSESATPMEIEVTNVKLTVDRTVPEGEIKASVGGGALVENNRSTNPRAGEFTTGSVTSFVIANTITPAPGESTSPEVVLTIGNTTIFVDGVAQTASAAPYIDENNRTMLPVSAIGRVLGANVDWNASARTVLITKDNNRVLLTIDKDVMNVNGMEIPMRSKAVITGDRTFVPLKDLGVALGVNIEWDAATQTVTVK